MHWWGTSFVAWIALHQAVWTHRKTYALAERLGLSETYAGAHIIRLWTWALDNATDDGGIGTSARVIAKAADWTGSAEEFLSALVACGWLDQVGDALAIHDWDEYAGKLVDRRRQDAERKRRSREPLRTSAGRPVDKRPDASRPSGVPDLTGPDSTKPDRTGDEAGARAEPTPEPATVTPAAVAAPPEVPAEEKTWPRTVPNEVPKPRREPNPYQRFLDRVKALSQERALEVRIRGAPAANGAAVRDSTFTPEQLAEAYVAFESGEWQDQHIVKRGAQVYVIVDAAGAWLDKEKFGAHANGKGISTPGRSSQGPDRGGRARGRITTDPRAFAGIDSG